MVYCAHANKIALFLVLISIFVVNIFFGYWRSNTRRFSVQWIMAVHIPVPLAIGLRLLLLGWSWVTLPVFVATFFAGQYMGGRIRQYLAKWRPMRLSSCLVMDMLQNHHLVG